MRLVILLFLVCIVFTLKSVVVCYVLIIHISADLSIPLHPNSEKKG